MRQPAVSLTQNALVDRGGWLVNLAIEDSEVAFAGADVKHYRISFDSTRSLLNSKLENDLKFRLGIQDYYLEKVELHASASFNKQSSGQV